jgi:putative membrane protein
MRINGKIAKTVVTLSLGSAMAFAQAGSSQNTPAPKPQSGAQAGGGHGQGSHTADHGMSSNKGAGTMVGPADEKFMMEAAQSGMAEVEALRLAQEKASSNEIKEFARKLEQDHTKANDQLKHLAEQKNVQLPGDAGKHKEAVEKIRNLSGDEFDKAFMKMQVKHHKKDVKAFQKEGERAMDSDVKSFASSTLPTLQEHLKSAEELQGSTRGRSPDTKTSGASSDAGSTSKASDSSAKPQGQSNPTPTK